MIPSSTIDSLAPGSYTIHLTVTSFYGASASTTFTFVKQSVGYAPSFILSGPSYASLKTAMLITSYVYPTSLCPVLGNPIWKWTVSPSIILPSGADQNINLYLSSSDLARAGFSGGTQYTFSLTGSFVGQSSVSITSFVVTISGSPLIANISGPSGWVPVDKQVQLDVLAIDRSSTTFLFSWQCFRSDGTPCFTNNYQVDYVSIHLMLDCLMPASECRAHNF